MIAASNALCVLASTEAEGNTVERQGTARNDGCPSAGLTLDASAPQCHIAPSDRAPPMTPRPLTLATVALCVAWVPAPPDPLADDLEVEAVERGPAIGEAELAPYFTTSALKSALSELQAGRAAHALRFLPRRPADTP